MFVAQTHQPGAEAEVDFGEVAIMLRGAPVTCTAGERCGAGCAAGTFSRSDPRGMR
ncbi:hypothetical protein GCM10020218_008480 [Dactylosporangium vinaceum]